MTEDETKDTEDAGAHNEVDNEVEDSNPKITIVPTSHISEKSSFTVRDVISKGQPDLVALELDQKRLQRLKQESEREGEREDRSMKDIIKGSKGVGVKGRILLVLFSLLQTDIAEKMGIDLLGMDMLAGYESATEYEIPVALVDRDIDETFRSFSSQVSVTEALRSVFYLVIAYFQISRLSDDELDKELGEDSDIDINEAVEVFEETFPTFKRILIDERDQHIAESTYNASMNIGDTVLVIGAAHTSGVKRILNSKDDVDVVSVDDDRFEIEEE